MRSQANLFDSTLIKRGKVAVPKISTHRCRRNHHSNRRCRNKRRTGIVRVLTHLRRIGGILRFLSLLEYAERKLFLSLCKCSLRQTAGSLLFNKMGILFAKSRKIISRARFFSTTALGVTEQRPSKGTHNARRQDERKNAEDHFVFHSDAPRV